MSGGIIVIKPFEYLPYCFTLSVSSIAFDLKDGFAGATIELSMKRGRRKLNRM